MRRSSVLSFVLCLAASGCISAEISEASQLSRLERGIDNSTTATDHTLIRGETAPVVVPEAPAPVPAAGAPLLREGVPEGETEEPETTPRPTIRVWGAPAGRGTAVSAIVYADAGATPPAPAR